DAHPLNEGLELAVWEGAKDFVEALHRSLGRRRRRFTPAALARPASPTGVHRGGIYRTSAESHGSPGCCAARRPMGAPCGCFKGFGRIQRAVSTTRRPRRSKQTGELFGSVAENASDQSLFLGSPPSSIRNRRNRAIKWQQVRVREHYSYFVSPRVRS